MSSKSVYLTVAALVVASVMLAGCAGVIEPFFALACVRHVLDGARLPETQPLFEDALRRAGAWSESLVAEVRETGSARHIQAPPLITQVQALPSTSEGAVQAKAKKGVEIVQAAAKPPCSSIVQSGRSL